MMLLELMLEPESNSFSDYLYDVNSCFWLYYEAYNGGIFTDLLTSVAFPLILYGWT